MDLIKLPLHRDENHPWSASSIKLFQTCPRKYYYYKTGAKKESVGSPLIFGSAIHRAVESFYRWDFPDFECCNVFEEAYKEMFADFEKQGMSIEYYGARSYKNDISYGRTLIKKFLKEYKDLPVVLSEAALLVELPLDAGKVLCYIAIDAIIREPDGYIISDVKSGMHDPSDFYLKWDVQLNLYDYGFKYGRFVKTSDRQNFKYIDDPIDRSIPTKAKSIINIRNINATSDKKVEFRNEDFSEDNLIKTVNQVVEGMFLCERLDYWPKSVQSIHDTPCKFCEYCDICDKEH